MSNAAKSMSIERGDFALHVDDHGGEGAPVVLIHGWPLSGEAWAEQVPALLEAGHRVVTYDRRGFGRSGHPADEEYGYDSLADDLAAVLEALDLRGVTLVGFSMGGGEAVRMPARHGVERVAGVVLAAAVPPYLLTVEDNPDGPLAPEGAEEMKSGLAEDRAAFFAGFVENFYGADGEVQVGDDDLDETIRLAEQSHQSAALACIDSFARTDFRGDLAALAEAQVPVLIVHGDADAIVPLEGSGQRAHAALPGSQLVVVPGAPHGLNLSHAEEFNDAVLGFLRR